MTETIDVAVHEAANIFTLDEEHIPELAENIRQNGHQVPIERLNGEILDGRRRYLACRNAGVVPRYKDLRPADVPDPIAYVLSLNKHRRHSTPTQLAMVGAKAEALYEKYRIEAKERQKRKPAKSVPENLPEQGDTRDKVGQAVGVSGKSIDHAKRVLSQGTPALVAAVEADLIAVSTAAKVATQSKAEQDALVQRTRERAASGRPPKPRPTVAAAGGDPDTDPGARVSRGRGAEYARKAIDWLNRIPRNDGLRTEGLKMVRNWLRDNK